MFPANLPSSGFLPSVYRPDGRGYWSGHIPFACDLIQSVQPSLLVELGSYYGESYFAFCEAISVLGVNCSACAIDTWSGDVHTGRYASAVFSRVARHNEQKYGEFSRLIRLPFDSALLQFKDESIDILHIDGSHGYESVRHDFDQWFTKVRPGGVILLHDIAVIAEGFGVYQLWEELEKQYPAFAFLHSSGLGVVMKPGIPPSDGIGALLFGSEIIDPGAIRVYYELCDDRLRYRTSSAVKEGAGEVGVYTQVFWRSPDAAFTEARSVRLYSTLSTSPENIMLDIPAEAELVSEVRVDIAAGRSLLQLQSLQILKIGGEVIWALDVSEAVTTIPHAGIRIVGEGEQAILDVPDEGGHLLIRIPVDLRRHFADGVFVEIRMCVPSMETRLSQLASCDSSVCNRGAVSGERAPSADVETLFRCQEALAAAERSVADRDERISALSDGLANAENLAFKRLEEVRKSAEALGDAQRLLSQRETKITSLSAALENAERLADARLEQLRQHEEARGSAERIAVAFSETLRVAERLAKTQLEHLHQHEEARVSVQQLVRQRDEEILTLTEALRNSERLARRHLEDLRKLDDALGTTQRLVYERDQKITALAEALGNAEQLTGRQLEELRQNEEDLGSTRRLVAEQEERITALAEALGNAEQLTGRQLEELRRWDLALETALALIAEREERITALREELTNAERVSFRQMKELSRYDLALANAEQCVATQQEAMRQYQADMKITQQRSAEFEEKVCALQNALSQSQQAEAKNLDALRKYADALGVAEKIALDREIQLREYDEALGHAQILVAQRERQIAQLNQANDELQTIVADVNNKLKHFEDVILEQERELCSAQGVFMALTAEKQGLLCRIDEFERSLAIRLARRLGHVIRG